MLQVLKIIRDVRRVMRFAAALSVVKHSVAGVNCYDTTESTQEKNLSAVPSVKSLLDGKPL